MILDIVSSRSESTSLIIPLKLEDGIDVPKPLDMLVWVDYFEPKGFNRLLRALKNLTKQPGKIDYKVE